MNREDLINFIVNINFELDKIENNEAYINNKSYFGLDKQLLSYIRKLEQALDEIEKYVIENSQYWDETGLRYWKDKKDEPHDILEMIQKAKGDVKNENNNI